MIAAASQPERHVRALQSGIRYLLERQRADGSWEDYARMPVGPASAWVTGFVATALGDMHGASSAVVRAAKALLAMQRGGAWGYNASVPPDADSTAWALRALAIAGLAPAPGAHGFLAALQRPNGGFATYARDDAWGDAHPDVTPLVLLALRPVTRSSRGVDYVLAGADAAGTWPAYWWRGRHYSTYWNRALLAAEQYPAPPLRFTRSDPTRTVETSFDLAWVIALAVLDGDPPAAVRALVDLLVDRQRSDGGWTGGEDLRVTAPYCRKPWLRPFGTCYRDDAGLITTASAVRALALATNQGAV